VAIQAVEQNDHRVGGTGILFQSLGHQFPSCSGVDVTCPGCDVRICRRCAVESVCSRLNLNGDAG
jgi:hypothetical protein